MPFSFGYGCACGHRLDVEIEAPDTPAVRLKVIADQGWGLDGLAVVCPCCIRHQAGEHCGDYPSLATQADVEREAVLKIRFEYAERERVDAERRGSPAVAALKAREQDAIRQEWTALQARVEAERIRLLKWENCRRCRRDPNDALLQIMDFVKA